MDTCFDIASRFFFATGLRVPAENKWLAGYEVSQDIAMMLAFHCLLAYCEHHVNAKDGGSAQDRKEKKLDDDYLITQDFQQTRAAYGRRAARFIHDPITVANMFFYLSSMAPVMVLHFQLFSMGVKVEASGPSADMDAIPGATFDFSDRARSPASEGWAAVSDFLLSGWSSSLWHLISSCLGPLEAWPDKQWFLYRSCLMEAVGGIFRRLIFVFVKRPWSSLCAIFIQGSRWKPGAHVGLHGCVLACVASTKGAS